MCLQRFVLGDGSEANAELICLLAEASVSKFCSLKGDEV